MSKIPCDVIKDLLPLYADNVCSEHSKDIVEEHLTECEDCREYYEAMTEKLPEISGKDVSAGAEDEFLTYVKRKLTYQKLLIAGIVFFVVLLIPVLYERLSTSELDSVIPAFDERLDTEDVRVTELYQLKDGSIYFTLESSEDASTTYTSSVVTPDSDNGQYDDNGWRTVSLKHSFTDMFSSAEAFRRVSYALPLTQETNNDNRDPSVKKCESIYYEGKENERITIWKEGQIVKPAPETVELRVKLEKKCSVPDPNDSVILFYDTLD